MATSQSIISEASAQLLAALQNGGVTAFRQNDSSAQFMDGNDWKALLMTLSDEEVQRTLDNSTGLTVRKFRAIGCS